MEKLTKKSLGIGFWIIIAAGIFLRISAYLKNPSCWFDESALAYNVLALKYIDFFGILHLQQVAPPLFLVLTKWVTHTFGVSDMILRLIPFIFGCLAFIPFYLVVSHIFEKPVTINFAMFLFAINPKLIYYGIEFKPYILDVFFALLIFWLFLKLNLKKDDLKKILVVGSILGLSVWLSFTSAIICAVGLVTILVSQKEFKKWLILIAPIFLNYLLFAIYYINVSVFYRTFMLEFFKKEFNHFTLPLGYFFNNEMVVPLIIISLTLIVGIIYFMMEKKKFELAFIMWSIVLTIILSQLHIYPAYERFTLFLLPYVLIIVAMTFNILIDNKSVQAKIVLVLIVLALLPTSITTKGSDSRELTEYFLQKVTPNDLIVIDKLALPDFLYYTYSNKMNNKIIVSFEKVDGRIMYKFEKGFEFPKYNDFWLYSTRTKGFTTIIEKKNGIETVKGYKILDKKVTSNGAVMHVVKEKP